MNGRTLALIAGGLLLTMDDDTPAPAKPLTPTPAPPPVVPFPGPSDVLAPLPSPPPRYSSAQGNLPGLWAQLPPGDGYVVRRPDRSWGDPQVVGVLQLALARWDAIRQAMSWPIARIGDISRKGGGPFPPHLSHDVGRDIDISFRHMPESETIRPLARLLFALLQDEQVGMILLNSSVQKQVLEAAAAEPELAPGLAGELQFPAAPKSGPRRVRHSPGHDNHIHVRYREQTV